MKRIYKYVIYIITTFTVIFFIGLIIKIRIAENLKEKKESIDAQWKNIVEINDQKVHYISKYYRDSLLVKHNLNKVRSNDEYTFYLYQLNEYFMNLELDSKTKTYLIQMDSLSNKLIKKYNNDALLFNKYASSFPFIIIARNNKIKRYKTQPIIFGQPNQDPKQSKKEMIEWLKSIEEKEGL